MPIRTARVLLKNRQCARIKLPLAFLVTIAGVLTNQCALRSQYDVGRLLIEIVIGRATAICSMVPAIFDLRTLKTFIRKYALSVV